MCHNNIDMLHCLTCTTFVGLPFSDCTFYGSVCFCFRWEHYWGPEFQSTSVPLKKTMFASWLRWDAEWEEGKFTKITHPCSSSFLCCCNPDFWIDHFTRWYVEEKCCAVEWNSNAVHGGNLFPIIILMYTTVLCNLFNTILIDCAVQRWVSIVSVFVRFRDGQVWPLGALLSRSGPKWYQISRCPSKRWGIPWCVWGYDL